MSQEQLNRQVVLENAIQLAIDNGEEWSPVIGGFIEELYILQNFAKALWGEELPIISRYIADNGNQLAGRVIQNWQFHLQQMVIAPDPIEYLANNIKEQP